MRVAQVMLRVVRITGWALLVLLVVQFTTVGVFERVIPRTWVPVNAGQLHVHTGAVIGGVALLHVIAAVYLAVRRWTWKSRHLQT